MGTLWAPKWSQTRAQNAKSMHRSIIISHGGQCATKESTTSTNGWQEEDYSTYNQIHAQNERGRFDRQFSRQDEEDTHVPRNTKREEAMIEGGEGGKSDSCTGHGQKSSSAERFEE